MLKKLTDNDRLVDIAQWIGFFVLLVLFAGIPVLLAVQHLVFRQTVTGKITKMWSESAGMHGTDDFITIVSADGSKRSLSVYFQTYGTLDIGDICTFIVNDEDTVISVNCAPR